MAAFRQRALDEAASHHAERYFVEEGPVSKYFGKNVLDLYKMRSYMSKQAYEAVLAALHTIRTFSIRSQTQRLKSMKHSSSSRTDRLLKDSAEAHLSSRSLMRQASRTEA